MRGDCLRREPPAAAHHAVAFGIYLVGKVVQPYDRLAIGVPIVAHEPLDQDVELSLTLIAFSWRTHAVAFWGRTKSSVVDSRLCQALLAGLLKFEQVN
jgi:hypothetical protein